jgi:bifunctional non-homologous end joining protein LigD
MRRRPNEKRDNWLLIKQHDDAAREPADKDILVQRPLSVKTGRTLDEIAQHKRKTKAKAPTKSKSKTARKGAKRKKRKAKRTKRR